jgi:hypothetical protein
MDWANEGLSGPGKTDRVSEGHLYHTGFRVLVTCQSTGEFEYITAVDNN